MKTVIYADILVAVNFIIDFGMLLAAGRLCGAAGSYKRLLAGAVIGGLSSLLLLAPELPWHMGVLVKAGACLLSVAAAFSSPGLKAFFRCAGWYLLLNFLLAGAVIFARQWIFLPGIQENNLALYFDVPPFLLISCVMGVYLVLELFAWLFQPPAVDRALLADIWLSPACHVTATAFYDTGFNLRDIFTGAPAVLVSYPAVCRQLPAQAKNSLECYFKKGDLAEGAHLIPCSTAKGSGVLPTVFCSSMTLKNGKKTLRFTQTPVAFTKQTLAQGQYSALVGPEIAKQLI